MGTRIYVGKLHYSANDAQLTQIFRAYCDVVDARVITARDTGRSKGFAIVEMSTEDAARRAIAERNGTTLDNRTLRVDEAGERPTGGRGGRSSDDRQGSAGGYGGYAGYQDRSRRDGASRGDRW